MVTGLEIPGFVFGSIGLLGNLVEKSLLIWRSLAATRRFGKDMTAITAKISMEYYRFMVWARISGVLNQPTSTQSIPVAIPGQQVSPTDAAAADEDLADRLQTAIEDAVGQILTLLGDISKITEKYAANDFSAIAPSSDTSGSIQISATNRQKHKIATLGRQTPFHLRFLFGTKPWDDSDKSKLQDQVKDLCYWNDGLEKLLPTRTRRSVIDSGVAAHVLEDDVKDTAILDTLIEASKHENEGVRTHAALWKERIELSKQEAAKTFDVTRYQENLASLISTQGLTPSKCNVSMTLFLCAKDKVNKKRRRRSTPFFWKPVYVLTRLQRRFQQQ
jgi:hypothetical protein